MITDSGLDALFAAHLRRLVIQTEAALSAEGYASLLIHSGRTRHAFLDDQAYPFRPNPHFSWWVPLNDSPDCFLFIEPGRKPLLLFHTAADYWHKPAQLPAASWVDEFEVVIVSSPAAALAALPATHDHCAFIGEDFAQLATFGCSAVNPPALLARFHDCRTRKSPYEVQCLWQASRAGVRGHLQAAQAFRFGASEYLINLAFLEGSGQREQEQPYQGIVALNENAATLHYQALERSPPAQRLSLLIDAGAACRGYASDITRTYAESAGDFEELILRMDDVQQSLSAAVRPGIDWRDLHLIAHQQIAELLRDAGVLRIEAEEAVDNGVSAVFLPHGLGHLLGLQVHDVGGFRSTPTSEPIAPPAGHQHLRLTRLLEEDFVVTMEPGIYFVDMLLAKAKAGPQASAIDWARVEQLRPWGGIRIEDNLVVTAEGHRNLTREAFAQLDDPG